LTIDTTFIVARLFLLGFITIVIIETKKKELDPKTPRLIIREDLSSQIEMNSKQNFLGKKYTIATTKIVC